jgi:hypothetical protein
MNRGFRVRGFEPKLQQSIGWQSYSLPDQYNPTYRWIQARRRIWIRVQDEERAPWYDRGSQSTKGAQSPFSATTVCFGIPSR